jgi:hypothetical protein
MRDSKSSEGSRGLEELESHNMCTICLVGTPEHCPLQGRGVVQQL